MKLNELVRQFESENIGTARLTMTLIPAVIYYSDAFHFPTHGDTIRKYKLEEEIKKSNLKVANLVLYDEVQIRKSHHYPELIPTLDELLEILSTCKIVRA